MDTEETALVVGALLPPIISILKQAGFRREINLLVATLICVAAGVLTAWLCGKLNAADVAGSVTAVLVSSQVIYRVYWRGTRAEAWLNRSTTFRRRQRPRK